ncbi:MAG: CBS domain-containing protein, partial [Deltaproteobacteria bacterium]|nr:CBS domain-containing protein [Deltaproteobacteria bacterium]
LTDARAFLASHAPGHGHQGFPVLDGGKLAGVVTRRDLLDPARTATDLVRTAIRRTPVVCFTDSTLREAADQMVRESVGRLPVVERASPHVPVAMLSRSDLLSAQAKRLDDAHNPVTTLPMPGAS